MHAANRSESVPQLRGEALPFVVHRLPIERFEKTNGRLDAGDPFLILRARFRALGAFVRRGIELRKRQRLEQLAPREEDAGVRAGKLIRGTGEKIADED